MSDDSAKTDPSRDGTGGTARSGGTAPLGGTPAAGRLPKHVAGYTVERELGRGGAGVVYLARDERLGRLAALKLLLGGAFVGDAARAELEAEARTVAGLSHPNVVQIYEFGEHDGTSFLALEYVPGGTLRERLKAGPLGVAEAAALVRRLALGVAAAHAQGVVHRDLKPANVLLTADGSPKVTDFGIAKRAEAGPGGDTETGAFKGTYLYMAPEQATGGAKYLTPAGDVHALGVILYECLTGRPPFQAAKLVDTLDQIATQEPVPPRRLNRGVPRDLDTIVLKCLSKSPEGRYADAGGLADDLANLEAGRPIVARPVSAPVRAWRWAARNPGWAATFALFALVVTGSLVAMNALYRDALTQRAAAEDRERDAEAAERRARANADAARAAADEARATSDFLAALFQANDPLGLAGAPGLPPTPGAAVTARDVLTRGLQRLSGETNLSPDARAALLDRIGLTLLSQGQVATAAAPLREALALRRGLPPGRALAESLAHVGWLEQLSGDYATAEDRLREALTAGELPEEVRANVEFQLGWVLTEGEAFREAEPLLRACLERRKTVLPAGHRDTAVAHFGLATMLLDARREAEAAPHVAASLKLITGLGEAASLTRAAADFQHALLAERLLDTRGARDALRLKSEALVDVLGPGHIYAAIPLALIIEVRLRERQFPEAQAALDRVLALVRDNGLMGHPRLVRAAEMQLELCLESKDWSRAEPFYAEWVGTLACRAPGSPQYADALLAYSDYLAERERMDECRAVMHIAESIYRPRLAVRPTKRAIRCLRDLGYAYSGVDRARGVRYLEEMIVHATEKNVPDADDRAALWHALGTAHFEAGGRAGRATEALENARALARPVGFFGTGYKKRGEVLLTLATCLREAGRHADAAAALAELAPLVKGATRAAAVAAEYAKLDAASPALRADPAFRAACDRAALSAKAKAKP